MFRFYVGSGWYVQHWACWTNFTCPDDFAHVRRALKDLP